MIIINKAKIEYLQLLNLHLQIAVLFTQNRYQVDTLHFGAFVSDHFHVEGLHKLKKKQNQQRMAHFIKPGPWIWIFRLSDSLIA